MWDGVLFKWLHMWSSVQGKIHRQVWENAEKLMFDRFGFENYSSNTNVDDIKLNYPELVAYGGKKEVF